MTPAEAKKALNKLGWSVGDSFTKRTPEDQEVITEATTTLAQAGISFSKPSKAAKKASNGES